MSYSCQIDQIEIGVQPDVNVCSYVHEQFPEVDFEESQLEGDLHSDTFLYIVTLFFILDPKCVSLSFG